MFVAALCKHDRELNLNILTQWVSNLSAVRITWSGWLTAPFPQEAWSEAQELAFLTSSPSAAAGLGATPGK